MVYDIVHKSELPDHKNQILMEPLLEEIDR